MLNKTYDPAEVEPRIYEAWERSGAFAAGVRAKGRDAASATSGQSRTKARGKAKPANPSGGKKPADAVSPYCVMLPPPNVTGSLHMGHALNHTIQDILARFERMRGRDVLWQPGMDHAGIATQMVVERQLAERGERDRREMGRDKFLERVWQWKAESGGMIVGQQKRLGESCDWSRARFTMDEGLSRAVIKTFVDWHRAGLIYRDKRLVNWDPKFQTAISDLEVNSVETQGHLWHLRYKIKQPGKAKYIVVATTRPETMLGDMAVAVHPGDKRWKKYVGKMVELPLTGREIPIIADEYADPEQGSGAVKITPAHDFNDFEVGRRHNLPMINIFDDAAHINDNAPEAYRGLDRFEARRKIVADLDALGLLEKVEDKLIMQPFGDRSGVVIEPYLTDQWFADAQTLAKPAIKAVEDGRTRFVPRNWEKTYFEWMRNIQPWCISRQLWWGHRIPAWYGPDGEIFVAMDETAAHKLAKTHYGKAVELQQDEDVLDTWFSSALWPFSTLGWPDETPELKRYYPTDVLVTGFDIIFFWVARMMMAGLYFMDEVPFHTVYMHALVRDEKGQKMSKSKGNVLDPLEIIEDYSADALRFTLAAMAAQGRDVKMSPARVEGYRNFSTKLWNAARFTQMNGCALQPGFDPSTAYHTLNRWIAGECQRTAHALTQAIEQHRYNEAAGPIYRFVWNIYCDWYLELIKPVLSGEDTPQKAQTQATAAWTLDQILKLLHPFMPFVTEELWARMAEHAGITRDSMLVLAPWPELAGLEDEAADREVDWVIRLISEIRSLRAEMNVPAAAKVRAVLVGADAPIRARASAHEEVIKRLARLSSVEFAKSVPKGSVQMVLDGVSVALPLAGIVDLAEESGRLRREIDKIGSEIEKLDAKLQNAQFVARAPEHVIEEQRDRRTEAAATAERLKQALRRIEAMA
jgi:valyl-tRNA synthetase